MTNICRCLVRHTPIHTHTLFSLYASVHAHKRRHLWRPDESIRFSGTGVTLSSELPEVGSGNQTWVLWKSSTTLLNLSHLFSPATHISKENFWPTVGWTYRYRYDKDRRCTQCRAREIPHSHSSAITTQAFILAECAHLSSNLRAHFVGSSEVCRRLGTVVHTYSAIREVDTGGSLEFRGSGP